MNNIIINKALEKQIINTYIPITKIMDMANIPYNMYSNFMCPFHYNTETPAAHLYVESSDGGGKIWCYSEQRMYGSWDVYKVYYPKIDTNKLAQLIVDKIGIDEIENKIGQIENKNEIPFLKDLDKFKERKNRL